MILQDLTSSSLLTSSLFSKKSIDRCCVVLQYRLGGFTASYSYTKRYLVGFFYYFTLKVFFEMTL